MHKNAAAGVAAVVFLGIESVGPTTVTAVVALAAARASLGVNPDTVADRKPRAERIRDLLENRLGRPLSDCPDCGAKDSLIRILLPPNARAPPANLVYVVIK